MENLVSSLTNRINDLVIENEIIDSLSLFDNCNTWNDMCRYMIVNLLIPSDLQLLDIEKWCDLTYELICQHKHKAIM